MVFGQQSASCRRLEQTSDAICMSLSLSLSFPDHAYNTSSKKTSVRVLVFSPLQLQYGRALLERFAKQHHKWLLTCASFLHVCGLTDQIFYQPDVYVAYVPGRAFDASMCLQTPGKAALICNSLPWGSYKAAVQIN